MEGKLPKGTRDSLPDLEKLRQKLIKECEKIFLTFNAVRMDTPTFELYSNLMEKYNNDENTKEIFVLENPKESGEKCGLRYDLTVPFSRYVKTNRVENMRRYQIGKVFRRDQPSPGRYREFYQCDYDCLGKNIEWASDSETLILLNNILRLFREKYNLPKYTIRVSSREILNDIMMECGISPSLFPSICSSIDKLDKYSWEIVCKEMIGKGLSEESIDKLKKILYNNDISFVKEKTRLKIEKVLLLVENTILDLKLARGLQYYTDLIFEVELEGSNKSIAAGGRYDNLCSSPCVGFSLGLDRILDYVSYKFRSDTKIWIIALKSEKEEELFFYKFQLVNKLREKGISVGTELKYCNPQKILSSVVKNNIPFVIFLGDNELENNLLTLKNLKTKEQVTITFDELLIRFISN